MHERDRARGATGLRARPHGVPGLDVALRGGLLRGGLYLVEGQPGADKTILGNQLIFAHVAGGGRAIYVTLLTEAHSRMLGHLRSLASYNAAVVGDAVVYLSGAQALEGGGLPALLALLFAAMRERRATLLVLDGLVTVAESAGEETALRRFMLDLQALVEAVGGTAVLLTRPVAGRTDLAHTMVDGVLALRDEAVDVEVLRTAEVRKFRGGGYLRGRHAYAIADAGIVVYPRPEARYADPVAAPVGDDLAPLVALGIPRLDAMLGGGLPAGAAALVAGAAGTQVLTAVAAAFGRALSEVGASLMVGGNILNQTRILTTAIALETGRGNFARAIALGLILLALAFLVNVVLLRGGREATTAVGG